MHCFLCISSCTLLSWQNPLLSICMLSSTDHYYSIMHAYYVYGKGSSMNYDTTFSLVGDLYFSCFLDNQVVFSVICMFDARI